VITSLALFIFLPDRRSVGQRCHQHAVAVHFLLNLRHLQSVPNIGLGAGDYRLTDLVLEQIGSKSKLVYRPLPTDDPTRRRPDITLAKQRLGWAPKVPLAEGLKRTIAWFRSIDPADYRPPTPNF